MRASLEAETRAPRLWQPQAGPQQLLLHCPVEDVLFGGARGGGKTDAILGDWLAHLKRYGERCWGVIFRRNYRPDLEEIIRRSMEIYKPLGAKWRGNDTAWYFGKARLALRHLERDDEAQNYQGHSYTFEAFDDMGTWGSPLPIDLLRACLRSPSGIPTRFRCSANPGGRGHNWIRRRYILPAEPYKVHWAWNVADDHSKGGTYRTYIPATLDDNKILMANDPEYWNRIVFATAGNLALQRAWRYGIWDIVAGGFFDDIWDAQWHVVEPFPVPNTWRLDRSFDWGSSKPFSVIWWAESDGVTPARLRGQTRYFPRGTLFAVAEWYGWKQDQDNVGLGMSMAQIAAGILAREERWGIRGLVKPGPCDPSCFTTQNGMCIARDSKDAGVPWVKLPGEQATRLRVNGWARMRQMLIASKKVPMEEPGLFVFNTCRDGILRTLYAAPRDTVKVEDIDTEYEDHALDSMRYRVIAPRRTLVEQEMLGLN